MANSLKQLLNKPRAMQYAGGRPVGYVVGPTPASHHKIVRCDANRKPKARRGRK